MKPESYLSENGKKIFAKIAKHLGDIGIVDDITTYELSMLANSFDTYGRAAQGVKENGHMQMSKTGSYQLSPDYMVMKTEYVNIVKHANKFGINPVDVQKVMKHEKKVSDALDDLLKGA